MIYKLEYGRDIKNRKRSGFIAANFGVALSAQFFTPTGRNRCP
jgi:hypothetical protein